MEFNLKEIAMISRALADAESNNGFKFIKKVGVYVGNNNGSDDHSLTTNSKEWYSLDDKIMGLVDQTWNKENNNGK